MTTGRFRRRNASFRPTGARRSDRENNFFLGMVGCSLLVHVIAAAIFAHNPAPPNQRRPPTISVDLVMTPVANPQRGSAGATRKMAAPPATPAPQPVVPVKVSRETVVLKGKEVKKTAAPEENDITADIAKMKERLAQQAELRETQAAIAALKQRRTPPPSAAAAAGSALGTGDEAGGERSAWLRKAVKEKWSWPDRKRKDLRAEVEVTFDDAGKLCDYRFIRKSADARFDDSLKRALLSLAPLPKPLCKPFTETILFNLDDLQGQ